MSPSEFHSTDEITHVGDDADQYFRFVHGRRLNTMNQLYMLPADDDEARRYEIEHRMMQFIFEGKNYVGPVGEVLRRRDGQQRQVLDIGTGPGIWAMEIADEFPRVEVKGVDIVPTQPVTVPANCTFEVYDIQRHPLPYASCSVDLIHARSVHIGILNYRELLIEVDRVLRPGGIVILVEMNLDPIADGKSRIEIEESGHTSGLPGWFKIWEIYKQCLEQRGVDTTAPQNMGDILFETGRFETIRVQEANVPIGFWPKDPTTLTVGQLAWMSFDLFLPALRPILMESGYGKEEVDKLVEAAQHDLYYPLMKPSCLFHVVHAIKAR